MEENWTLILSLYATGLLVSGLLYAFFLGKMPRKAGFVALSMLLGAVLALPFAKLFYLLHSLGRDAALWTLEGIFPPVWQELSFTGGCIGFVLGVWLGARLFKAPGAACLDAFALPGCVLIAFARMAEMGMDNIGQGDLPSFLPDVFPLAVHNSWGLPNLAVFTLEALTAAGCAVWLYTVRGRQEAVTGRRFEQTVVILCGAQLFLEMLTVYYWIPFIISFIHLEQVLCALILLMLQIPRAVKTKKAGPLAGVVLMLGLNALMQFAQDKPYLFPIPTGWDVATLATVVFALTAVGSIVLGLKGLAVARDTQSK